MMDPVVAPIGAITPLLLLHEPPGVASVRFIVDPTHTEVDPVIGPGNGFTISVAVTEHPTRVYVMVSSPAFMAVTKPVPGTIVALVLLLLHVPPVVPSLSVVVEPTHIDELPVIATGVGFTVINCEIVHPVLINL